MKLPKPLNQIKIVPRWIIFTFDIAVSTFAFFVAYLLHSQFEPQSFASPAVSIYFLFCICLTAPSYLIFRLCSRIVRYTSAVDSIRILSSIVFTSITLFIVILLFLALQFPSSYPTDLIHIYALFAFIGLTPYRT